MEKSMDETSKVIHGENVVVRVGAIIGFLAMFGAGTWWASGIQSDLNSIKVNVSKFSAVESIASQVATINQYGGTKTLQLESDLIRLRQAFDLHVATTVGDRVQK